MGHATDLLCGAFVKVQMNPELLLQENYIMSIFLPLFNQLPELKEYLDYYKEEKEGNAISSMKPSDCVLCIDKAMAESFHPNKEQNQETEQYCLEL